METINKVINNTPVFFEDSPMRESIAKEFLSIEVTTKCNSKCIHCFARAGLAKRSSLNPGTAKSAIAEGYELGYRRLHLTGGEPLLWPHFDGILDYAFSSGYEIVFCNTNGTLLSKERCAAFTAYGGKLSFSVSLQGGEKLHDSMRGKGAFGRAASGIRNALEAGINVNIFTSVGKSLLEELPAFVHFVAADFPGIDYITLIQLIRVHKDQFNLSSELLNPKEFIQLVKTASLLSLYGIKIIILENPLANVVAEMLNIKWLPSEEFQSRPGRSLVMADGNITVYHSSRESFGIYSPGALREMLYSDAYRNAVAVDCTGCGDCSHKEICERNRIRRPSEWFRDMHPEIPFCRRVLDEASLDVSDWKEL
jgi:MoaA/NifB/PqqE/SkfB family radical SAM enzyme